LKRLALFFMLLPGLAYASVSGMDDINPNIPVETQEKLDEAITTYYQHPSVQQVDTVLDIMNDSDLLRKKTAWPPMVGFLTVIFENNKEHLFDWMARNDYNQYAQDVFISALLHAKLKETALVFAQAHQWKKDELENLQHTWDDVDLKQLEVTAPGHIDTLWGAFFASGDVVYVNEIINVLLRDEMPFSPDSLIGASYNLLKEDKKLAENTLRQYAPYHEPVRRALSARIAAEKDTTKKQLLQRILRSGSHSDKK